MRNIKVTLKLFAGLVEYLPPKAAGNAVDISVPAATTPRMLIRQHRLPSGGAKVVMLNGEFLPPEKHDVALQAGDVMAVWPSIQGG